MQTRHLPKVIGVGPALFSGWLSGSLLGAFALWLGLGWLAALTAYSFGGAAMLVLLTVLPAVDLRPRLQALQPIPIRVGRG